MRGGFRIGTIRGIPIRIHVSFLVVLPLLAWLFGEVFQQAAELAEVPSGQLVGSPWLWGLGIAVALFLAVLLHELAHSFYAVAKGGEVKDITLLIFGGVSQISRMPPGPKHEALMALVGPLTSVAVGVLCFGVYLLLGGVDSFNLRFALFYLGYLNIFIGVFNLLPAFPMDGGRILRAGLTRRFGRLRATQIAAGFGKAFALLLGALGLFTFNVFAMLIAFFIFVGAQAEAQDVAVNELLGRLRVGDVMSLERATVPSDYTLEEIEERMALERRLTFWVTDAERVVGLVSLDELQAVTDRPHARVRAAEIARKVDAVSPDDDVGKALRSMGEQRVARLPVVHDGQLVGTLGREEIARVMQLKALQERRERSKGRLGRRTASEARS